MQRGKKSTEGWVGIFFCVCVFEREDMKKRRPNFRLKNKRRREKKIEQRECTKENQQLDKTQRIQNSKMQTTHQPQRKADRYDFFMAFWWTVGTEKRIILPKIRSILPSKYRL